MGRVLKDQGTRAKSTTKGYLTIIGRVKDQFKTDKGKYISPPYRTWAKPKHRYRASVRGGDGRAPAYGLTVLSAHTAKAKPKETLIDGLVETVGRINKQLEPHEQVEKW